MPATIIQPAACSPQDLAEFMALAVLDKETHEKGLPEKIAAAEWLGFYREKDKLAAIAALQRPVEGYRKGIFKKAGASQAAEAFPFELCWAVTLNDFRGRGLCSALVRELLAKAPGDNIFAVMRSNNNRMADILKKQGFLPEGFPYSRRAHRYTFQLYLRAVVSQSD